MSDKLGCFLVGDDFGSGPLDLWEKDEEGANYVEFGFDCVDRVADKSSESACKES